MEEQRKRNRYTNPIPDITGETQQKSQITEEAETLSNTWKEEYGYVPEKVVREYIVPLRQSPQSTQRPWAIWEVSHQLPGVRDVT